MKKRILHGIAIAAMTGLVLTVRAQDSNIDQTQYPTILQQPVDQCLPVGGSATFSVVATNVDYYQWYKNNVALDGQTNSSLTIASAGINDVGFYGASVIKGSDAVPTRMACLNVYVVSTPTSSATISAPTSPKSRFSAQTMSTMSMSELGGGGVITVFGAPVVCTGSAGSCPGAYSGYVVYARTISQGWGWAPTANASVLSVSDTNRADTHLQVYGKNGDTFCDGSTLNLPLPAYSPKYRFTVYFAPNTQVPTNAYPLTLTGFDP